MQEDEAGNDSYYQLKKAIIKQFGPKKADNFDKAISRVMTGTPSQLGRQILADICPAVKPLNGCHCEDIVLGIWRRSLPQAVRNQIADMDFNKNTDACENIIVEDKALKSQITKLADLTRAASKGYDAIIISSGSFEAGSVKDSDIFEVYDRVDKANF